MKTKRTSVIAVLLLFTAHLAADHVILDDCIIDGSMAVGLDAVNGENFGFDTLRLKENNLRFHFDDTSVSASFPRNDWRFIANDSANGGDSYLAIEDVTGGRIPFRVEAGASNHSLFVESTGQIGLGTNNPVVELHVADGDTPTVRLEQNGSSGWNPQTWDVAGNETNFFIRDVTNGSKLPFRIRPDAPTSSLDIEGSTGDVGIGKSSANADLHVYRTSAIDTEPMLLVESNSGSAPTVPLVKVESNTGFGAIQVGPCFLSANTGELRLSNNNFHNGSGYSANFEDRLGGILIIDDGQFRFFQSSAGTGVPAFTEHMKIDNSGNVDALGTFGMLSDREAKADIEEVDTSSVLERLAEIPIATWRYKREEDITHMGPMAQDFHAAFGLGKDEKKLGLGDASAVALASAQELHKRLNEKDGRIAELEKRNAELEQRMARIEEMLRESR